jgi:3-oxoacyl-[acyl-carrier-protein] synthase II
MSASNPVILGYDAVTALGSDMESGWQKALAGRSGIAPLTRFLIDEEFPVRIAGQAPDIDELDYPFLTARHKASWTSPVFRYSMLTVARALERSGLEITKELAPRVAVTYSSAIGGIDAILSSDRRMQAENKLPLPYANPNSCINMIGGKIAIQTGAQGPIVTPVTACATGLSSMIAGAMFLAEGRADVAICGAVDFALVEPIVAGFYTMNGVYNPKEGQEGEDPQLASRPFSKNRRGFVISEGAGAVILATPEFAKNHKLSYQTELAGWGMTSDAHHFVAPYFETIKRCMENAMADANITPADIAAVNAHAASTRVGDKVEFDALKAVFGKKMPPVAANKSLIGHAMGASSVIESIFSFQGMRDGVLAPTINYQPDPEIEIDCVANEKRKLNQEFVLKNSFGFGGCNSCAVFRQMS